MFFNNNFTGANAFGPHAYPFETASGEPSTSATQTSESGFDPTLDNLSAAEIEGWWLAPKSDDGAGQYTGSTLLDSSWGEFASPYDTQAGYTSGTTETNTGESYRPLSTQCSMLIVALDDGFGSYAPEHPTAGPSTAPYPARPAELPSPPLATFTGPTTTPSPVPALSWGCECSSCLRSRLNCLPTRLDSPLPTDMYTATGNDRPGMYNQPPTEPDLRSQWPYPTSVGKGKARATDHFPPARPSTTGDTSEYTSSWIHSGKSFTLRNSVAMPTAIRAGELRGGLIPANGKSARSFHWSPSC